MFRWIRISLALLAISATAAYAALPGSHRVLSPTLFGLHKFEQGFYTDDIERRAEFEALYQSAKARSAAFHGPLERAPWIIFCTTNDCKAVFDLKPRGLTLGPNVIFLGPLGTNEMILTHELSHIQLHRKFGLRDIVKQRIPAWFNEGLATYLSADPRVTAFTARNAKWVTKAQGYRDWGDLHASHAWPDTYGAAKSLVADLHREVGDEGLRALIEKTHESGDFNAALTEVVGPEWP